MKLLLVISANDPENLYNALRLASFSQGAGDTVSVFLMGAGVEIASVPVEPFNVIGKADAFLHDGGDILACGTCLERRGLGKNPLYTVSDLKALRDLMRESDKVLTF
ncbi:MAG TPA: DsrE family protein [Armatimonadota bacterium]|jgi:uncharacterized protein involved in oxidation of intracellular sulfur